MKDIKTVASELAALVEKVKDSPPYRADLLARLQEILVEKEMAADVITFTRAIETAFDKTQSFGSAMRVAGAIAFIAADGDEVVAPEVLGALGTGCIQDPDALEYVLKPGW